MSSDGEDTTSAPALLGLSISLQLVTAGLVGARITTRIRSGKTLQWHDWAILMAELLSFPQLIFIINATVHGYGRQQRFVALPDITEAMRSVFMAQVTWYWSTTLVKISVVCLLLSLKRTSRNWIIFFYTTMSILLSSLVLITATQFLACNPVSAFWDLKVLPRAKCWPQRVIAGNVVAYSVIQALSDVVFSFIPLTFLLKLNQPLRERIVISILMGLGIFASGTAIARTTISVTPREDMFRTDADITLLSLLDLHVGIIAATLPTLKVFFEGCLIRLVKSYRSEGTEEDVRAVLCELGLLDQKHWSEKANAHVTPKQDRARCESAATKSCS